MRDLKQEILSRTADDLEKIEIALKNNMNPYLDIVSEVAGHILFSGGKRLRPLIMVLSSRICGYKGDYDIVFSTMFEYLHAATLLHDDLVDGAKIRRGKPVANMVWDNSIAVLVGDFLLARALSITAKTGNIKILDVISEVTENMSQGEIQQLLKKGDINISEKEYNEVIWHKTAVLFQGACRVSALIANAPEEEEKALSEYGLNLGMAFQMADDLLDYTEDSAALGKQVGADLREGKLTLPLIHALKTADEEDRARIKDTIKNENFSIDDFKRLIDLLYKHNGIGYTRQMAADHIDRAKQALTIFDHSETKEVLISIADYALARKT